MTVRTSMFLPFFSLQVVVILVICVISLLVVYMGFLLCLDPMMKQPRKDHPYARHENDEVLYEYFFTLHCFFIFFFLEVMVRVCPYLVSFFF